MTPHVFHRRACGAPILVLALMAVAASGCGDKGKQAAADSNAAAPATVRDMSATPNAPDSTAGVANPTGQPSTPGDTLGARGRDSTKGPRAGSPVGGGAGAKP